MGTHSAHNMQYLHINYYHSLQTVSFLRSHIGISECLAFSMVSYQPIPQPTNEAASRVGMTQMVLLSEDLFLRESKFGTGPSCLCLWTCIKDIQAHSRGTGFNCSVATQPTNLPLPSFVYSRLTIMWGISFVLSDNVRMNWMYSSLFHCLKPPKDWVKCQRFREEGYFLLIFITDWVWILCLSFRMEVASGRLAVNSCYALQHLWYKLLIHDHIPLMSCILLQSLWGG